jgi:shikimate kinase
MNANYNRRNRKRTEPLVMANQIIIIGFMGTGKTTVARELAQMLNFPLVDLDELIATNEGRTPKQIIEQDGEDKFREIETQRLREVLVEETTRVVAVGGGAWTIARNRRTIADHRAFTVWLDAPFELCWQRIEAGHEARPLAPSRELAETLYDERRGSYELADARITIAENDSVEEIAAKISRAYSRQNPSPQENIV